MSRLAPIVAEASEPPTPRGEKSPPFAPSAEDAQGEIIAGPDNSLLFIMASGTDCVSTVDAARNVPRTDPMLDNGAPYRSIVYLDLCTLTFTLSIAW